jgi:cyclase
VVLDIKKKLFGSYEVYTHNGKKATGINPIKFAQELEALGVGELVLNSIDQDGMMKGYDLNLIEKVVENISIPVTVLGGAGSLKDIETVIEKNGVIGVAAGSLFVFKGPYKAVLITSKIFKNRSFF